MSRVEVLTLRSILDCRPKSGHLTAFYAAFLLAAGFGQWLGTIPNISIILWPPNGVFIATLLLNQKQTWPWWIGVALLAELTGNALWFHNPLSFALAFNGANAVEAVTAAWLLSRFFPPPARLHTLRQVIALVVIGVAIAPMVGATIGSAIDAWREKHALAMAWPLWWIGDATGVLIAAPLSLVMVELWQARAAGLSHRRLLEAAALVLTLFALGVVALEGRLPLYIVMPPLLWAAVRFEFTGAAITTFLLALMVAIITATDPSLFTSPGASEIQTYISTQLFLALSGLIGLVVAAVSRQRRQALIRLSAANDELEMRVCERTAALRESEARFRNMADHAPVMVWVTDGRGECTFLSSSWNEFTGQTRGTGQGFGWLNAVHPDDRTWIEREFLDACAARASFRLEYRLERSDGRWCWVIHAGQPRFDDSGNFLGHIGSVLDISDRKAAEEQNQFLTREIVHRSNNLLALIKAVASLTASSSPEDFVRRFGDRLQAISSSQDLLVQNDWKPIPLEELVRAQLGHLLDEQNSRIFLSGPAITVSSAASQTLGMALHELATNAAKYGALSSSDGEVRISWSIAGSPAERRQFAMEWIESGGPQVLPPARRGFGSRVISDMVAQAFRANVSLDFAPSGLAWGLNCPAANITQESRGARETIA